MLFVVNLSQWGKSRPQPSVHTLSYLMEHLEELDLHSDVPSGLTIFSLVYGGYSNIDRYQVIPFNIDFLGQ